MNIDEIDEIDGDVVCKYYNKKYDINMQYISSDSGKIESSTTNTGYIVPTLREGHYYGVVFIDTDDKINKYCIIADTIRIDQRIATRKAKQDNRKIIRIGEGIQNDAENCKVFAINMVKYLLQNDCKIAKSLIDFYSHNKQDGNENIHFWLFQNYRDFNKKNIKTNEEYKTLEELLTLYKKDKPQVMQYVQKKQLQDEFMSIANSGKDIEEIKKGITLLYDVPNEDFLKWEYAGEFLKLAQSSTLQSKVSDKKVGKQAIEMKNYANFYSSLGKNVEDITGRDKEKLQDKKVSTKIYCKKEKYKNITNNSGNLDEATYRKKIKPMINVDTDGSDKLRQKYQNIK